MNPEYIFQDPEEFPGELRKRLSEAEKVVLLLDYDGTLVPICKKPSLAVISESMRNLLLDLSNSSYVTLALVTGRSFRDIRKMIRMKDIIYISNHGFQITWGLKRWVHPEIKYVKNLLYDMALLLKEALSSFYLVALENKKFTLSIHYRGEENKNAVSITKIVENLTAEFSSQLKITRGKKVIELRPRIMWDKGSAVIKLLSMLKLNEAEPLVIYIGDDKTDEDAFRVLPKNAFTIRVGKGRRTCAKYCLHNFREVEKFLMMIKSEKCSDVRNSNGGLG